MADSTKNKTTTKKDAHELSDFEQAAQAGLDTAKENGSAEGEENKDFKSGSENVEAKVTTSEAQPELKPEGEEKNVVAKKADKKTSDNETSNEDAIAEGLKTAEKNHKAEVAANKEANRR